MDRTGQPRAAAIEAGFVPFSDLGAAHGESPVRDPRDGAIWWVDTAGRRLLRTGADGRSRAWDTPERPGFVQIASGHALIGMESGIFRFDPETGRFARRARLDLPGQRFNDACPGAAGTIWAGTMDLENRRANGVLFRFDAAEDRLEPLLGGFRTLNGLAWDGRRRRLYVSDSHPDVQRVWLLPLDPAGGLGACRDFARFDRLAGRPDGAMLDAAGGYWIAAVGGGRLYRFGPDGGLSHDCALPLPRPTKPALLPGRPGGPGPALVLTGFAEPPAPGRPAHHGRLMIWRSPPPGLFAAQM